MTLISYHSSAGETGRCDAKCYGAKEPVCHCICGGKNHGVGQKQAVENTRELSETWIEKWKKENPDGEAKLATVSQQLELF